MNGHWLNRKRLLLYPAGFFLIYLALALLLLLRFPGGVDAKGNTVMPDFMVFWAASHLALTGNPLGAYDAATIAEAERLAIPQLKAMGDWIYPPMFYLVVLPLALLPFFWSYVAFMASTFLAYVAVLRKTAASSSALMAVLGFPAVCLNFVEGQNGFLVTALFGGALLLLPARPLWAGFLIGLLTIKPQLGLLLPIALLCGRQWGALGAATVTSLLFLGISLVVLGPATLPAFLGGLSDFSTWAAGNRGLLLSAPTLFSFLHLLGLSTGLATLLHFIVAGAVAAATGWTWYVCRDTELRSAVLVAGSLLISPYLLDYDLVCLSLAIAWFVRYGMRRGWKPWEREVLVLAWLLPALTVPFRHLIQVQLSPFVLLALFLMILRRVPDERKLEPVPAAAAIS
jgi:hypothetical protein